MKTIIWLLAVALPLGVIFWVVSRRAAKRRAAAEQREASMLAEVAAAKGAAKPAAAPSPAVAPRSEAEWLLLEAAAKAGAAGEAALSIQLYARLLARYPNTALAAQARSGVEEQKKKVSKV